MAAQYTYHPLPYIYPMQLVVSPEMPVDQFLQAIIKMYTNPTSGTIISGGNDVEAVNRLVGSSNTLDADIKSGGDGFTVSGYGTTPVLYQPQGATSRTFGTIQLAVEKGSSVVVNYDPNGQEPFQIYVGFQTYISEADSD